MSNAQDGAVSALASDERIHELAALVLLLNSKALPADRLVAEVELLGAVETLQRVAKLTIFDRLDVEAALREASEWIRSGRDVRTVFEVEYPQNLAAIFNKPPLIFIKGSWREASDSLSVAVVGTRKPSPDGVRRAQVAARKLADAGITVISGLAAGIDTVAHTAALDAHGRTVAVMGTGIDRVYPTQNEPLAERILESGGALITQFFPDQAPTQWTFPMRNVTMSGLSLATLVIEAGETSGARQQARHALQHGRSVFLAASLVRTHEWARRMVEKGLYGAHALVIENINDVIARVAGHDEAPSVAAGW